ncbi:hypothetical protein ACFP6A_12490 [Quadrisphaera sp. GCM10027208]|uniref:hypothetical protein n=1 Tax=Quadrisphaera sp. GCM10027208 TaxID=3273423 RepID=UPI00361FBBA4
MHVLVVDAANVVGSRPTGWWRDRAGAAARLHASLLAADLDTNLDTDLVVLVLEGAARAGQAEGTVGRVRTVHAEGSGDDAVVATVHEHVAGGDDVTVVTADRGLRERVTAAGGTCVGPSRLLDRLPE